MGSFKIKLKGGGFVKTVEELLAVVGPAVKKGGLAAQAGVMATSPVKSGTLRRSWTTGEPVLEESAVKVQVGTNVVYARYQDQRTKNAGFVQAGIDAVKEQTQQTVQEGIKAEVNRLWAKD